MIHKFPPLLYFMQFPPCAHGECHIDIQEPTIILWGIERVPWVATVWAAGKIYIDYTIN